MVPVKSVFLAPFIFCLLASAAPPDPDEFAKSVRPVLVENCAACHNSKNPRVDFLKAKTAKDIEASRGLWHNVAEQLRNRSMPPVASKITEQERLVVSTWVDSQLRATACNTGDFAGPIAERRLNRREYHNTIRDLLGVDFVVSDLFPADGTGGAGFDTNGETLYVPPLLMERYLQAAQQILDRAIITPPLQKTFTAAELVPAKAFTTPARPLVAGEEVSVTIPAWVDGDYEVSVSVAASAGAPATPAKLELKLDGVSVGMLVAEPPRGFGGLGLGAGGRGGGRLGQRPTISKLSLKLERGPHVLTVRPGSDTSLISLSVNANPPELTAERRALHYRLFGMEPGESPVQPRKAAQRILAPFVAKAWRRPVQPAELNRFMALYDRSAERGDPYEESVKLALKAVLISPDFLFRIEDRKDKPGIYPLGQYEIATRLSYFLWATMPDEELLRLASQGRLQDPKVLTEQVDRMLDDARSRTFVSSFIGQWLGTQDLGGRVQPIVNRAEAYYNTESAADLRQEPILLFDRIVREDRSLLELLTADYTYLNERLAKYYEIEDKVNIHGDAFQLVKWPDDRRAGLLGMAAPLAVTGQRQQTSPVLRGAWVLETILGTPVPPPPPGVPPLPPDAKKEGDLSMRAKLLQHRGNPVCSTCHNLMDPIGFGLENFDALGRWREADVAGNKIDASGALPSGEKFVGPVELRQALLGKKDDFMRHLTGKVLGYALGRSLQDGDSCTVQRLTDAEAKDGYRARTMIREVVLSVPFRNTQGGAVKLESKEGAPVYRKQRLVSCVEDGSCTPLKKPEPEAVKPDAAGAKQ
ncbi:MAG: DUF1592 domain-containing protein [Terriglobia bacterium]